MSAGDSFETFGVFLKRRGLTPNQEKPIHRDTLYNWAELYPEFSDAKKFAFDCRLYSDEQDQKAFIKGDSKGNPAVFIHKIKCTEPKLYLEKTVTEVHNKNTMDDVDTSKLNDEELSQLSDLIGKCKKQVQ